MNDLTFKPVVYFKQNCPFCLKVRLFLLEAGIMEAVEIRDFVPGSKQEEDIRAELGPHLAKASFPAAQLELGRYIAESDDIIAFLAVKSGREPASLPVFGNYVEGPFKTMMNLWKENQQLKAAAV
ncbi:glutathione S-transferase N-terminal domain-containing protein [Rhizobium lusitanum]|uniref:glutathione S-transferase N-terminal domain-containing protein n=1 Tax=Rhizobium lusitanum TaxID=293958 RepID=UPI00195E9F03|nr:glutathione S-transferase N-terminal domain-containing protein [Rhizobium lusitanum]MBM7049263.1 glutathione S-transferase domain-containing protein [Rhizobium lusitanum]